MKRNLVIVRAGDHSLHPTWSGPDRTWDLVVSYYGDDPASVQGGIVIPAKGSKWQGLSALLESDAVAWKSYDYIWLPDDDLAAASAQINNLFRAAHNLRSALCQPSLVWDSYASHVITCQHKAFKWRQTNFVEVMAPCFSSAFLQIAHKTFRYNLSGWGLDYLWPTMLRPGFSGAHIIDTVALRHTRPVGIAGHGASGADPRQELEEILRKFNIRPVPLNYSGGRTNGQKINIRDHHGQFMNELFTSLPDDFKRNGAVLQYLNAHDAVTGFPDFGIR